MTLVLPCVRSWSRVCVAFGALLVLSACAPSSPTVSRIPNQIAEQTRKDGLFPQPLVWQKNRPGCTGECPSLKVDSLIFPGVNDLTELIDSKLASMGMVASETQPKAGNISQFEAYYWNTAGPRDETLLAADIRYANKALTVLELSSWQYYTGAAHGNTATQFMVWDNTAHKTLGLDELLLPGARPAYEHALQQAHEQWLLQQPDALHDPQGYRRLWPFQPSNNAAPTDKGLLVKYNSYEIAPYSSGQPELLIPYNQLKGILRPAYLPAGS
jgi:hypothetical protein